MMLTATATVADLYGSVGAALTQYIEWLGTVITALLGSGGALRSLWPLAAMGIAATLIFIVVRLVKSFAWGF
jgi:hypothetical protein